MACAKTGKLEEIVGWLVPLLLLFVTFAGCNEEIDMERKAPERGTFGEEVHRILHHDIERSPLAGAERAQVLMDQREEFVAAVDGTLTDDIREPFNGVMIEMMPLYDSELIPGLLRKVAVLLGEAQEDEALLEALARGDRRPQLLADPSRDRLLAHVIDFDETGALSTLLADTLLAHDTYGPNGFEESDATIRLLTALQLTLAESELDGDPGRFSVRLVRLLSTEQSAFQPSGEYEPLLSVAVDPRGLPAVSRTDLGTIPFPFSDGNNDGLADVDEEQRFVSVDPSLSGQLAPFGEPNAVAGNLSRDSEGRLINPTTGGFAYQYIDLHRTALGMLLRDAGDLAEDDVIFDLLRALEVVLGETEGYSDELGAWRGFRRDSSLAGLMVGLLVALDHEDVPAVLEGVAVLLREHPDQLAAVLDAAEEAFDLADEDPTADFADDSNLADHMLPLLRELLETPGLLEDVLLALDDPVAKEIGPGMAMLMRHKNEFITVEKGGAYDACFQSCDEMWEQGTVDRVQCIRACPNEEIFAEPMDFNAPESPTNRSLMERLQGLMWESAGTEYPVGITHLKLGSLDISNTAQTLGPAMVFPDLAANYLMTMTRDLHLEDMVSEDVAALGTPLGLGNESVVGIVTWIMDTMLDQPMDPQPTTAQVTRFFNLDPLARYEPGVEIEMNMSICRSGFRCIDAHADTLFAVEAAGLADAMVPLAAAFTKHGKTDLLPRLFGVLYEHYPTVGMEYVGANGMPLPLSPSNLRSVEPVLIEVMEGRRLLDSLGELATTAANIELADGSPMVSSLERHLLYVVTEDPSLTLVDGRTAVTDLRGNAVSTLSPMYLILAPLREVSDVLDANPAGRDAWDSALEGLADVILATEEDGTGGAIFTNPGGPMLVALAVIELRGAWLDEEAAGTRSTWLRDEMAADVADLVSGRGLRAGLQIFDYIDNTEGGADLLQRATLHIMEHEEVVTDQLAAGVYLMLAGTLDGPVWVPMANFLATAIDPARSWQVQGFAEHALVVHGLMVLDETSAVDPEDLVLDVAGQGLEPMQADGTTRIGVIWETIRQMNRAEPGATDPLGPEDYGAILAITEEFILDEKRGLERFYGLIEFALHGPDGKSE